MPDLSLTFSGPHQGRGTACEAILHLLPEWFGIEDAIRKYRSEIDELPTFTACRGEDLVGFLTVKIHFSASAELYVMGVRPEAHRQGVGRALFQLAREWLKGQGVEYLQVKTLGPSRLDEGYARTRSFYMALGFQPLEEFQDLWDAQNPCLILIQRL